MINNIQYKYLFLDRDGVINTERPADYVKNISEFVFEDRATEAIAILSEKFEKIFVITNQRGVGRGIMNLDGLQSLHDYMVEKVTNIGGRIDDIYFCTDICSTSVNRKPNIGMAFQVLRDYPDVDLSKSIMVGNSRSDIEFGNKAGMYTVLVGSKYPQGDKIYTQADIYYENLYKFAESLK